jgi:hypothetical protein
MTSSSNGWLARRAARVGARGCRFESLREQFTFSGLGAKREQVEYDKNQVGGQVGAYVFHGGN